MFGMTGFILSLGMRDFQVTQPFVLDFGGVDVSVPGVCIGKRGKVNPLEHSFWLDISYHIGMNLLEWHHRLLLRFLILFLCAFGHLIAVAEKLVVDTVRIWYIETFGAFP